MVLTVPRFADRSSNAVAVRSSGSDLLDDNKLIRPFGLTRKSRSQRGATTASKFKKWTFDEVMRCYSGSNRQSKCYLNPIKEHMTLFSYDEVMPKINP